MWISIHSIVCLHLATPLSCVASAFSTLFVMVQAMDLLPYPLSTLPVYPISAWMGGVPALDVLSSVPEPCCVSKRTNKSSILSRLSSFSPQQPPLPPISAIILLPHSPSISHSSSSHSSSWFPSCLNDPLSIPMYTDSSFHANALELSIDFFSFPSSLFSPFSVLSVLSETPTFSLRSVGPYPS